MIKLPRTYHLQGSRLPSGKSDPGAVEFDQVQGQFLVVEEKVDGSGVSISLDSHLNVQIYHRGSPATSKEYDQLHDWADRRWEDLLLLLGERYVLFGEWMQYKHTLFYDRLPHYFLESDIYDQEKGIWLSTNARNNLLKGYRYIKQVPMLAAFKPSSLGQMVGLIGPSQFISTDWSKQLKRKCELRKLDFSTVLNETDSSRLMEGLYVKHEDDFQVLARYKYVRYDFVQKILASGTHVRDRVAIYNMVYGSSEYGEEL